MRPARPDPDAPSAAAPARRAGAPAAATRGRALSERAARRIARLDSLLRRRPAVGLLALVACAAAIAVSVWFPDVAVVLVIATIAMVLGLNVRLNEQTMIGWMLIATYLIPATLIIKPLGQVGVPALLLGGLLLLLWCYGRCDPDLGLDLGRQPVRYAVLAYAVAVVCGYIAGQVRGLSSLEASGADAALIALCFSAGIVLFVADSVRSVNGIVRIMKTLVAGSVVLVAAAWLQRFEVIDLYRAMRLPGLEFHDTQDLEALDRSGFYRVQGLAGHPIEYSVVIGMLLPVALHLALTEPRPRRDRWWVALVVMCTGLPLAVSRSGVIAAGVSLAIYVLVVRVRTLLTLLPLAIGGLFAMGAAMPGLLGTLRSLFLFGNIATDPSVAGRTDDYAAVLAVWSEHPLFGIGSGTYIPSLYRILDNEYLYTLATMGLVGVVTLIALFAAGYSLARRAAWRARDFRTRGLAQAIAAAIAAAAVCSMTFDSFGYKVMFVLTHTLIGSAAALWRLTVRDKETGRVHIASPVVHRTAGPQRRQIPRRGVGQPAGADLR